MTRTVAIRIDRNVFTPAECRFIRSVISDTRRGWQAVFPHTRLVIADDAFLERARRTGRRPLADVFLSKRPNRIIARWFPSMDGFSFTYHSSEHPIAFVVMNEENWTSVPAESYFASRDLLNYRRYLINHELGHAVFRLDHRNEPVPGHPFVSVMGQQTIQKRWDPTRIAKPNPFPINSPECHLPHLRWNRQ